jgi:hypothetical protein
MNQQNQQLRPGANDDNSSTEEGDFVMLEQQFAAVDVSEQQHQIQARKVVTVNWQNSNGCFSHHLSGKSSIFIIMHIPPLESTKQTCGENHNQ